LKPHCPLPGVLEQAEIDAANRSCAVQRQQPRASSSSRHTHRPIASVLAYKRRQIAGPSNAPQQAGSSNSFEETGGHTALALEFAGAHCQVFQESAAEMVNNIRCCGWCGQVGLGGVDCKLGTHWMRRKHTGVPPAVLAYPAILELAVATADDRWERRIDGNDEGMHALIKMLALNKRKGTPSALDCCTPPPPPLTSPSSQANTPMLFGKTLFTGSLHQPTRTTRHDAP
jgi:hypothetical protein